MTEQHQSPLTKADLTAALLGLEARLDAKWESSLETKLDAKLAPLATKEGLRIVQVAVARLEGDVREINHSLKTKFATKKDMEPYRLHAERTLKELDEHRELRSTRGVLLTDAVEKIDDHERRLHNIEGRS